MSKESEDYTIGATIVIACILGFFLITTVYSCGESHGKNYWRNAKASATSAALDWEMAQQTATAIARENSNE